LTLAEKAFEIVALQGVLAQQESRIAEMDAQIASAGRSDWLNASGCDRLQERLLKGECDLRKAECDQLKVKLAEKSVSTHRDSCGQCDVRKADCDYLKARLAESDATQREATSAFESTLMKLAGAEARVEQLEFALTEKNVQVPSESVTESTLMKLAETELRVSQLALALIEKDVELSDLHDLYTKTRSVAEALVQRGKEATEEIRTMGLKEGASTAALAETSSDSGTRSPELSIIAEEASSSDAMSDSRSETNLDSSPRWEPETGSSSGETVESSLASSDKQANERDKQANERMHPLIRSRIRSVSPMRIVAPLRDVNDQPIHRPRGRTEPSPTRVQSPSSSRVQSPCRLGDVVRVRTIVSPSPTRVRSPSSPRIPPGTTVVRRTTAPIRKQHQSASPVRSPVRHQSASPKRTFVSRHPPTSDVRIESRVGSPVRSVATSPIRRSRSSLLLPTVSPARMVSPLRSQPPPQPAGASPLRGLPLAIATGCASQRIASCSIPAAQWRDGVSPVRAMASQVAEGARLVSPIRGQERVAPPVVVTIETVQTVQSSVCDQWRGQDILDQAIERMRSGAKPQPSQPTDTCLPDSGVSEWRFDRSPSMSYLLQSRTSTVTERFV